MSCCQAAPEARHLAQSLKSLLQRKVISDWKTGAFGKTGFILEDSEETGGLVRNTDVPETVVILGCYFCILRHWHF